MHWHVRVWDRRDVARDGAVCPTRDSAEFEAQIERTTPSGAPNGKRVEVKSCELSCLGGAFSPPK